MIDIDTTGYSEGDLEGFCKISSGWHLATVVAQQIDKKNGSLKVTWMVESAPWSGSRITDTFNLPALAMSQEDVPGLTKRITLFFYRMGLIPKSDLGKRLSADPAKLLGIERVIEVKRERNKKKPEDSNEYSNIVYGAYWGLDRPEIPVAERVRLGLPLLAGQETPLFKDFPPVGSASASAPGLGASAPTAQSTLDPSEI